MTSKNNDNSDLVIIMMNITTTFMKKNLIAIPIQRKEVSKVRLKNGFTKRQKGKKNTRNHQNKT